MSTPNETESLNLIAAAAEDNASQLSRRSFFKRSAVIGATTLVAAGGLTTLASALTNPVKASSDTEKPTSKNHRLASIHKNPYITSISSLTHCQTATSNP